MRTARPAIALDPRLFGRAAVRPPEEATESSLADDLRLFATTFACGFAFVSVYLL